MKMTLLQDIPLVAQGITVPAGTEITPYRPLPRGLMDDGETIDVIAEVPEAVEFWVFRDEVSILWSS